MLHISALCVVVLLASHPVPLQAQVAQVQRIGAVTPEDLHLGPASNPGALPLVAAEVVVRRERASFLQLRFGAVRLSPGSRIELQGEADGQLAAFDQATLRRLGGQSLVHAGASVRVRLVLGAGAQDDQVQIAGVVAGDSAGAALLTLCGNDTRQLSAERRVARLFFTDDAYAYTGTGFLIDPLKTLATAGHNFEPTVGVIRSMIAEFNVPASTSAGVRVPARLEDQYPWEGPVAARFEYPVAGSGPDWGVFRTVANPITALWPGQAQGGFFALQAQPPRSGQLLRVTGCGRDDVRLTRNVTQQTATGPAGATTGDRLDHRVDTTTGNSGSPVLDALGRVVAVHTSGGCDPGNAAATNHGTLVRQPAFAAARQQLAGGSAEVAVSSFLAPATAAAGTTMSVSAQVDNLVAGSFTYARYTFVLSHTQTLDAATRIVAVGSSAPCIVSAGSSPELILRSLVLPTDVAPGTWQLGLWVDSAQEVIENDEANNLAWTPITITAPVAGPRVIEYQHTLGGDSHQTVFWDAGAVVTPGNGSLDSGRGGTARFAVTAPDLASHWCVLAWSATGGAPFLPDVFTDLGLANLNRGPFVGWLAPLDGRGVTAPSLALPGGIVTPVAGIYVKGFFLRPDFAALSGATDWFAALTLR